MAEPPVNLIYSIARQGWQASRWCILLVRAGSGISYVKRALALLPNDYCIRCSAARTVYVLGDPEPMQWLRADPGAHVSLANNHRKRVNDHMVHGYSTVGARSNLLAFTEYQETIDPDPTHIEALTNYAVTFEE